MTEVLLLLVKVSVGVLILAIGMGATLTDLTYMWRRPGLRGCQVKCVTFHMGTRSPNRITN